MKSGTRPATVCVFAQSADANWGILRSIEMIEGESRGFAGAISLAHMRIREGSMGRRRTRIKEHPLARLVEK
jgi:hypothetical protein